MTTVMQILNYLKTQPDVITTLSNQFDFDLVEVVNSNYSEIPSNRKRILQTKFVELGLIKKEAAERVKRSNLRKDDLKYNYYNYDFKMFYLENHTHYSDETMRVIRVFFRKFSELEKELDKDLYDFNAQELQHALKGLQTTTLRSMQNVISIIGKYVDYAISIKKSSLKENIVYNFSSEEIVKKLIDIDSNEKLYLTKLEVMSMATKTQNAQDGVILALLYDGFSHKNNYKELINLKVEDIDWSLGEAYIESRLAKNNIIKLSKETLLLLKEAIYNDIYYSSLTTSDVVRQYSVKKTKYVLRGLRSKDENTKISWRNINQRILRLADEFNHDFLTGSNINVSSQIDCATEAFLEDRTIGDRSIRKALEKFNYPYNRAALFNLKKKVNMYKGVHIS